MAFVTIGAVSVCWYQAPEASDLHYDDILLGYAAPTVPKEFEDGGRASPVIDMGAGGQRQYEDGQDLYLRSHYHGWICITFPFVAGEDYWKDRQWEDLVLDELPSKTWSIDHVRFAADAGEIQATDAINHLIEQYGETELRERLKQIPWYRNRLRYLWGGMVVALLCGWIAIKTIQSNGMRSRKT